MIVMSIAYSVILRIKVEYYPIFLLSSLMPWTFLSNSIHKCSTSIIKADGLIKRQYFPKIIFPIRSVLFEAVMFILSLFALLILSLIYRPELNFNLFYLIFSIPIFTLFCGSLGIICSILTVYVRDTEHIITIFFRAWFYITPIIYPLEIVPERYYKYMLLNPATHFMQLFSEPIYKGISPGFATFFITCFITSICVIASLILIKKYEGKLIYRI